MGRKAKQKERKERIDPQQKERDRIIDLLVKVHNLTSCDTLKAYVMGGASHASGHGASEEGPPQLENLQGVGIYILSDLGGILSRLEETEDAHFCPCCERDEEKDTKRKFEFYIAAQVIRLYSEKLQETAGKLVHKFDHTGFLQRWEAKSEEKE